jgi:ribosomal protein L34E
MIGPGELNGERNSAPVADQMTLAARLSPVGRIGTRLRPPKTARTELRSTTARDQSILLDRASQSRSTKWINCQTPTSCQSRRRRQQVMPEPHPSSCGSISQGIPLRRTKRMPNRHARFAKRGLPPFGLAFAAGMKGSMSSHNPSGNSSVAIAHLLSTGMIRPSPRDASRIRFC